jgi:hypothetical protein
MRGICSTRCSAGVFTYFVGRWRHLILTKIIQFLKYPNDSFPESGQRLMKLTRKNNEQASLNSELPEMSVDGLADYPDVALDTEGLRSHG